MTTTRAEIRRWFDNAKAAGATHMLVVCDTFDYDDYPVDVMPGECVRAVAAAHNGPNMTRLMEVYAMHLDRETQLAEGRAFHYEYPPAAPLVAQPPPRGFPMNPTYFVCFTHTNGDGNVVRAAHPFDELQEALDAFADATMNGGGNVRLFRGEWLPTKVTACVTNVRVAESTPVAARDTEAAAIATLSALALPGRPRSRASALAPAPKTPSNGAAPKPRGRPPSPATQRAWKSQRVARAAAVIRNRLERAKGTVPTRDLVNIAGHAREALHYGLSKLARDKIIERVVVKGVVSYRLWPKVKE
jgi:hypothetical protein